MYFTIKITFLDWTPFMYLKSFSDYPAMDHCQRRRRKSLFSNPRVMARPVCLPLFFLLVEWLQSAPTYILMCGRGS